VTLRAEVGAFEGVLWASDVDHLFEANYGGDVAGGVTDARRWHLARGGEDALITVMHVEVVLSDITPDAVRLAATAAAWKALGNPETELLFDEEGDCWLPLRW
jgi:hypothetical protein